MAFDGKLLSGVGQGSLVLGDHTPSLGQIPILHNREYKEDAIEQSTALPSQRHPAAKAQA